MDKKLERELQDRLKDEENKALKLENRKERMLDALVIFFGTLGPLYILFFMGYRIFLFIYGPVVYLLGVNINWILPFIHGFIWTASFYSVYRKRSVLDDLIKYSN